MHILVYTQGDAGMAEALSLREQLASRRMGVVVRTAPSFNPSNDLELSGVRAVVVSPHFQNSDVAELIRATYHQRRINVFGSVDAMLEHLLGPSMEKTHGEQTARSAAEPAAAQRDGHDGSPDDSGRDGAGAADAPGTEGKLKVPVKTPKKPRA